MATGRVPTTANSPLTAKGDLFGYSTTQARVAVGSDGDTLVADSAASTGLRYTSGVGLVNPTVNGSMDIWQRGTSFTTTTLTIYTADRWCTVTDSSGTTVQISRQSVSDSTNLPSIQYCARVARTTTGTAPIYFSQSLETVNSIPYAGKTVTLSFWARKGSGFSASGSGLNFELKSGTGTDQNGLAGYTGSAVSISSTATLTTTWQRFTGTGTVSSTANELAITFYHTPSGATTTNDYYEVTGVQIDVGQTALPIRRSGGTIQGELAACQRYYYRITPTVALGRLGFGNVTSTTAAEIGFAFPVTMRTAPTALEQSGTAGDYSVRTGTTNTTCSAVPAFNTAEPSQAFVNFTVASGLTAANAAIFRNVNTSAYLGWSAEL